jgi:hypothetical protein
LQQNNEQRLENGVVTYGPSLLIVLYLFSLNFLLIMRRRRLRLGHDVRQCLLGLGLLLHVVVAPLLHEQLREMDFAEQDAVERGVGGRCQDAASVRAFEAALVVWLAFQG